MSIESSDMVTKRVINLLTAYSGKGEIDLDHLVGKDIGITGGDSVELLDQLEEEFKVNLHKFIADHSEHLPPNWWDRIRGRTDGPPVGDVTVGQLIEYIQEHQGQ